MPGDLTRRPLKIERVAIIGSCLAAAWPYVARDLSEPIACDLFLFDNATDLPPQPPGLEAFDLALVQLPLRTVVPDYTYFRLAYDDPGAYDALFADCVRRLDTLLAAALRWNRERGLLTFVTNFLPPQQNSAGRFLPRYDLRNPVYFVEELNRELSRILDEYRNAYILDFDQIVQSFGRRYFQDDALWQLNHASALSDADFELDSGRLHEAERATEIYPVRTHQIIAAAWMELLAGVRTLRGIDPVKIVIVDLDDTLWRGIMAERAEFEGEQIEGWPLGVAEALLALKRRGILLAIASKNDESVIAARWDGIFQGRLSLEDFAVIRIDWRPKAEQIAEILASTNLLASSALFVDDNPVERAAAELAFPGIRVAGARPILVRRTLLWSPETQVPTIGEESARRTQMVRHQIERDRERHVLPRSEFLAGLNLAIEMFAIGSADDPRFVRTLELINKTNQFNTTGTRWTAQELAAAIERGQRLFALRVRDRFTDYGLVAAAITDRSRILQYVMSCRVAGLDVEIAAIGALIERLRERDPNVVADFADTPANLPSRDLFARCGLIEENGAWRTAPDFSPVIPAHVELRWK